MGLFDRFREGMGAQRPNAPQSAPDADEQAIARYRYMLRTAPPETVEQAHAEAFAQLTAEQRRRVLAELAKEAPEAERPVMERVGEDPAQLARVATRAEIRRPGTMERMFGAMPAAPGAAAGGLGGLFAGSFLASMAGTVLGSMIAQHFFANNAEAASLFGEGGGLGDAGSLQHADHRTSDHDATGGDDAGFDDSDIGGGFDAGGDTFDV
jgi:hypothetical protein